MPTNPSKVGLGDGIVDADVFGPHKLNAVKLGGFEAELFAHFLADAAESGGLKLDCRRAPRPRRL
jgi:hypothetical protein